MECSSFEDANEKHGDDNIQPEGKQTDIIEQENDKDKEVKTEGRQTDIIEQENDKDKEVKTEEETKTTTFMEYEVYCAAENGQFNKVISDRKDHLQSLLTPNKSTILHVYLRCGAKSSATNQLQAQPITEFAEEILKLCPRLLIQGNAKGETPLHIAARYGHASIVDLLIKQRKAFYPDGRAHDLESDDRRVEFVKEMLGMVNQEKDTALHEAVRFHHLSVVTRLIQEDCDFQYSANDFGETPLYMAVERGYQDIVSEILDKCKSPATSGPNGRNVLHAATIRKDEGMLQKILAKKDAALMLKQADEQGMTPLHQAAKMGYLEAVKLFIETPTGREAAYMQDKQGNTALHLAAVSNHKDTTLKIIERCPDCSDLVNSRGWSVLHSAVQSKDATAEVLDAILKSNATGHLINQKDNKGNTPLHHIAISLNSERLYELIDDPRVDKMAFNKQNRNALDLASASRVLALREKRFKRRLQNDGLRSDMRLYTPLDEEEVNEEDDIFNFERLHNASLIVAGLIATVTFTAGFTVPGGFVSEKGPLQGTPILGENAAFKTFIIFDTIAMVLSTASVFVHLFLYLKLDETNVVWYRIASLILTMLAIGAMVVAFATGTYGVLEYSKGLAIVSCVIALSFFFFFYLFVKKCFEDRS